MESEAREEAAPAEAVEARGDGVAGVEERDAGVKVCGDRSSRRVALAGAGERGPRVREREREEVGHPRGRRVEPAPVR